MILRPPSRLLWQSLYSWVALPLALGVLWLAAMKNAKLHDTLRGRRGLWRRLEAQLAGRDPTRPLVWFHVASAGEYLQALPVLARLLENGVQCALTVTSVSGYRWAMKRREDLAGLIVIDYLPVDLPRHMRRMLTMLRPAALVYVKYDLWPNLVWGARRAGVPQFLVSATLHEKSWRWKSALARHFYRTVYEAIDHIFAASDGDRARFLRTAPGHPGVRVLGDTRFDSVLERKATIAPPPLPPYVGERTVMVVGSSWPPDEARIFPVLLEALERFPALMLLVVPHEFGEAHLREIEATFAGHPTTRFTRREQTPPAPARVLLVDTVDQLSALYAYAALAYVGGAFTTGVHNVMDPSAMGAAAIFGPFYQNSPEAVELVCRGLAFSIADEEQFRRALFPLLDDPARCRELGGAAAAYVSANAGAAQRAFEKIRAALA